MMTNSKQVMIPSVVGVGDTDLGMLSLGDLAGRQKTPLTVSWGEVSYLVGEYVALFARPVERLDFGRLADGAELRALVYATLGKLLGKGPHPALHLMVGLPVEVMLDREAAKTTRRALRGWLLGPHEFSLNGTAVEMEVASLEVMAQPAGTFFAWGMSDGGRWVREAEALEIPIGVCDIGFNTVDLFSLQGGGIAKRYTDGDALGMRRTVEVLVETIARNYQIDLSLHEADALMRQKEPVLYGAMGKVDLREAVAQALEAGAGQIVAYLNRKWGNGRNFAHTLLTGGGAEALKATLLRHYPHATILPEAVTANALGLARYARHTFGTHGTVIGLDPGFGGFKATALFPAPNGKV